ncbi:pericentriolar material 1 protein isoform X10 [Artibeus jamaicensis]|uniref:pericentriolar material 1 protein isoform X10 n=1 Tax=Artibeus jamaicensis TaxID=9417 RepID=UPI00235A57BE|nr:pericentriolar material 1 protein isoform X10 [Artibeus jamaicensis]
MAAGGGPFEEGMNDQDSPHWSNESVDDRLNNMDWGGQQKKANRSSEKNKKKFGVESDKRVTNDISPESSPGVGRRRTKTPHTFPHSRYMTQMSVPEQAELEKLKQRINFSDLDQRSIGSDSQGRATAANNKRQLGENRKPFNCLPMQINTNKSRDAPAGPQKREGAGSAQCKELFASALSNDLLQNCQVSEEDGRGEPAMESSQMQVVSRLVQIRDYITKASSMREDLVEKNERSANVERLTHLIDHLKEQEKSYMKVLQKILARDPQQEPMEEMENLKKQHDLLKRMLEQQEQLRALQGRQAALLALQHKAEQAIAVMDDSEKIAGTTPGHHTVRCRQPDRSPFHQRVPLRETTGSLSGVSITSELNEELNDLIQRFHNQLRDSQPPAVPDNRRQAESLSLTREVSQSRNPSVSEHLPDEKVQLFSKMRVLQEKKQKMDKLLGELHTLRDQHLNNSFVPPSAPAQRSVDQRSPPSAPSAPVYSAPVTNGEPNSLPPAVPYVAAPLLSQTESENEGHLNPTEKLQKLNEVRKRLNELRELVHYYEQTSDMMTDAVNENTKDEETEESEYDSEHETSEPVTNILNPQVAATRNEVNSISNAQCVSNNRDGRSVNSNCEINNRSAANIRALNMPPSLDCRYNREGEQGIHVAQGEDDEEEEEEGEDEGASAASLSSHRSSVVDEAPEDAEFEQKINRLMVAKQKLRQLQDLVAMVQDDDAVDQGAISASTSHLDDFYPAEDDTKQTANNTRGNANKTQKDTGVNEKAREKFYEAKLQQQQRELKQLQEERKKLIKIQEKIQALQKACPDLQLSATSAGNCPTKKYMPAVTSTPTVNENETNTSKSVFEPEVSSVVDNELWSEMRRHEILREELRQRRKQLEALMAEHQRRQGLAETASPVAASLRSDGSENLCTPQQSRTEKTMATWGGSTQCALDEEGDEDGYLSEGVVRTDEEEEEEQDSSSNDNFSVYPPNSMNHNSYNAKETKNRWKNNRPFSADGNYRPLAKTRQQNISMQRQENLRWVSELSYVEEKEQWQEQINQLKKQLDFSVNICQTLMQDQQALSCLLQTLLTGPYSVMPSNVASPQVHLIMHQLNQCYTQLTWQQNNVQRLKQMLNELMRQQNQHPEKSGSKERGSSASHPPSPSLFCPFSFPTQPVNLFNLPGFTNFSSFAPGMNFSPLFPSNFGDFSQNISTSTEQQQPLAQNSSGKTEYMAFPKPFESSSSIGAEKQRNQKQPEEEVENSRRTPWLYDQEGEVDKPFIQTGFAVSVEKTTNSNRKNQLDAGRRRQCDEESLESFSSMPDPVDPTTVSKTFKARKASAQASLASKDRTPKSKSKKRHSTQLKSRIKNTETGSDFSMFEALRDTIYSEVATLISQNESRPHFLIELFHELQLLNTDYLRQRALYALQDIVSTHISENHEKAGENNVTSANSGTWIASNSELTPSESLATTDDETFEKNFERETHKISEQNDADNASVLSVSSNFEPFATDDLGNTVIHLDQALARMREYERMKTEAESNTNVRCTCKIIEDDGGAAAGAAVNDLEETPIENHSLQQPVSETSAVPCPRIDTQQLDRQIKAIMKEVIPFLKEHMDEVCSPQLLTSVRRMVLTLTQQNDESKEFVKFFHKQLGSILQDSLAKFAGRKLKDCGEDLLVEISEVLFNELAFFKLMQDLDNNSMSVKQRCKRKIEAAGVIQSYAKEARRILEGDRGSPAAEIDEEDKDKDETETGEQTQTPADDGDGPQNGRSDVSDQEEDEESEECPVSISLSKAETQALTNYGSGEDENEDEEMEEFEEGPVDVQTSLQANTETAEENEHDDQVLQQELEKPAESKNVPSEQETTASKDDQDSAPVKPRSLNILENERPLNSTVQKDSPLTADSSKQPSTLPLPLTETETLVPRVKEVKSAQETPESSLAGSSDTDSPVLVNDYEAESGNISQKSDEEDFVKVEDLPLKLTIYSEADLRKKMVQEEQKNHLSAELLCEMQTEELAGNSQTLKEPETVGAQST